MCFYSTVPDAQTDLDILENEFRALVHQFHLDRQQLNDVNVLAERIDELANAADAICGGKSDYLLDIVQWIFYAFPALESATPLSCTARNDLALL